MSIFVIYLLFSMLTVLWFDVRHYIIPNWLVGSLLVLYPVAVLMSRNSVDWQMALAGMLIVFAVGYVVFAMKWMGGGDIKLITVLALWVGFSHLLDFIFLFGLLGGVFSVLIWGIRKFEAYLPVPKSGKLPRILRNGEPIPYGVAIAGAFLILLGRGEIPVVV